jgi:hypothetical protein
MIKSLITCFACIAASSQALSQPSCLDSLWPLPQYSFYHMGPNAAAAAAGNSNVVASLNSASDTWDNSNADDRFVFLYNTVNTSDCPDNQYRQIGAFNFQTTTCASEDNRGIETLAYMHSNRSVSVNLYYVWHAGSTPAAGEHHLASVLAHEFGHALGLGHMAGGSCQAYAQSCSITPGAETMTPNLGPGETCKATVEANDISSANSLYP